MENPEKQLGLIQNISCSPDMYDFYITSKRLIAINTASKSNLFSSLGLVGLVGPTGPLSGIATFGMGLAPNWRALFGVAGKKANLVRTEEPTIKTRQSGMAIE